MKVNLDNFDEKSLKNLPSEPYITLHKIRDIIKKQKEKKVFEEVKDDVVLTKSEDEHEVEFKLALKKLVDSPIFDVTNIILPQVKDIFNAVGERIEKWQKAHATGKGQIPQQEDIESLILFLHAANLLFVQQSISEKVENAQCLVDIFKESEHPLVISLSARLIQAVSGSSQSNLTQEITERVAYLSIAQNLLLSPEHHFSLIEIDQGVNKFGESLVKGDFMFEVERLPQGLNDKPQNITINIHSDKILNKSISVQQIAEELITKNCRGVIESNTLKSKLTAKIIWFRFLQQEGTSSKKVLAALFSLIKTSSKIMVFNHKLIVNLKNEQKFAIFSQYIKDSFLEHSIQFLQKNSDKELSLLVIQALFAEYRQRQEIQASDPFIKVPEPSQSSQDEQQMNEEKSFLVKALQDLASLRLEEDGLSTKKIIALQQFINPEVMKSSYFQWCLLRLIKQIISGGQHRAQLNQNEIQLIISSLLKIVDDTPSNYVYKFNARVTLDATILLRNMLKPRFEEQHDAIKKFENRLVFEITNLEQPMSTCPDHEDLTTQQENTERQTFLRQILTILNDLVQRDRENVGISRKIQESQILAMVNKLVLLNTPDKGHLVDNFFPMYFALVGQICLDNPPVTPSLIKNGVIPSIIQAMKERISPINESFYLVLFGINQMSLQEEGRKLIEENSVFKDILLHIVNNETFSDQTQNAYLNQARNYLFNLFDRIPAFKIISSEFVTELILRAQEISSQFTEKYYRIHSNKEMTIKAKNDEINIEIKKNPQLKVLTATVNMIINFTGNDDRSQDRQVNSRHAKDIFNKEIFERFLLFHEDVAQNPALIDISQLLAKGLRCLVEIETFPENVKLFIDALQKSNTDFEKAVGQQLFKLESLQFTDDDNKMEDVKESSIDNIVLRKFHQLLIQVKTLSTMHSQSLSQVFQNPKTTKFMKTIFYILRITKKMKIESKIERYQRLMQDQKEEDPFTEAELLQKKNLQLTQKQFNDIPMEQRLDAGIQINLPLTKTRDTMLKEKIPAFGISIHSFDEMIIKFGEFSLNQQQRQQRDPNQREEFEKNLLFVGKLAFKMSKQVSLEVLQNIKIDNSVESLKNLLALYQQLEEIIAHSTRGWTSGASFYEFFKLGGLQNMIECFNWLGSKLNELQENELLRSHYMLIERSCQQISSFFLKFIIDDEKNPASNRQSEAYMNSLITIKMGSNFESIKHFYQNVVNALLTQIFPIEKADQQNPLQNLSKASHTFLLDVTLSILSCASRQFQNCRMLKISKVGGDLRQYEQMSDMHRGYRPPDRHRNQPNPNHVQQLIDMGFNFSRERIVHALQQTRDNVSAALNLLIEWQQQQNLGIEDNGYDPRPEEGQDSDDNEQEDIQLILGDQQQPLSLIVPKKESKVIKVNENQFAEVLKKTSQYGFKWMLDAYESIDPSKSQNFILETMRNEKSESDMKSMFAKIDEIFKRSLRQLMENIHNSNKNEEQSEKIAVKDYKDTIALMNKVSSSLRIIQKLIMNQKQYLKEALNSEIPNLILNHISQIIEILNDASLEAFRDKKQQVCTTLHKLLYDFLMAQMSFVHMIHLQINAYLSMPNNKRAPRLEENPDSIKRKIDRYRQKVNANSAFKLCLKLIDIFSSPQQKSQALVISCFSLALRTLMDKDALTREFRPLAIQDIFMKLKEVNNKVKIEHKIVSSIAILYFENDQVMQAQMEKFTLRVLYAKYEHESGEKKQGSEDTGKEMTKAGFNNFLQFFSQLSQRNQELFKKIIADQCEVKSVKKGGQVSLDQANIFLKENAFNEMKKQVPKERALFKSFVKSLDIKSDKQLKSQLSSSKKSLLQQIPEDSKNDLQAFVNQIGESTGPYMEDFNAYLQQSNQMQSYVISKEQDSQLPNLDSQSFILDMFSKLCQAYPAYSIVLLPQKQQQNQNKKFNFFQWYIKEYLLTQFLTRSSKQSSDETKYEISFQVKSDTKLIDSQILRFLNKLTGYNHLMTLNEQVIKHQLRYKFVMEALSNLQKVLKDKGNNHLKQKCLILSSLSVLEALVNNTSSQAKQVSISSDNFTNSLRACFVREAQHKDLNLPQSLLKLLDDLLSDFIDVSLPSNSDIVCKCVSILKLIGDFIQSEKKKEENKKLPKQQELRRSVAGSEEEKQHLPVVHADADVSSFERAINQEIANINAQSESSSEDENQQQQQQIPDENDEDEDQEMEDEQADEDDEDEDEDDDDEGDENNEQMAEVDVVIEDDYYEEEDEDDSADVNDINAFGDPHRLRREGGPQFDIININMRPAEPHNRGWGHFGHPFEQIANRRHDRGGPEFTEEEAQVQRILSNLRGNQQGDEGHRRPGPRPHEIFNPHDLFGQHIDRMGRQRQPDPAVQEEPNLKKSLIEQTFEDFKIISEKELFDMLIAQRNNIEIDNQKLGPRINPFERGGPLGELGLLAPHRQLMRVDEIDDIDIIDQMRLNNPFLERILRHEDLNLEANIFQGLNIGQGFNHRDIRDIFINPPPRYGAHQFAQLQAQNQNQGDLQPYDSGTYNQQLRTYFNQPNQNNNQILGAQLLSQMEVQAPEEERKEQPQPVLLQPPRSPNIYSGFHHDLIRPSAFQPQPGDASASDLSSNQQLLSQFFSAVQQPPVIQPIQPNIGASINNEFEEIRNRMQQQSRELRDSINQQQESLQRLVIDQQRQSPNLNTQLINQASSQIEAQIQPSYTGIQPLPNPDVQVVQQQLEQASSNNQPQNSLEQAVQQVQQVQIEQIQVANQEEEKKQEPPVNEASSGKTFGYDNEVLIANNLDPAILLELPEELRAELLSQIELPQIQQPIQQQPLAQEEQKDQQQQQQQQQQPAGPGQQQQPPQQPEYYAIAQELGLDPEFLANLPEEMRDELITQAQQQQMPVQRQPEQMDVASFVATVTDPNLRREIFLGMDEAVIATLPPNLMAEARRIHDHIRMDRQRLLYQDRDRARGLLEQLHQNMDDDDPMAALFNRRYRDDLRAREQNNGGRREKSLEEIVNTRQKQIADETFKEDISNSLSFQVNNDERLIEFILIVLLANEKIECELIPCIQSIIKIQNSNGVPIIRNKIINAFTFILKSLANNEDEALKSILPNHQLKKKNSALILIGTLRLILKQNKSLMKFILKGLVSKEETSQNVKGGYQNYILKKQIKAMNLGKSPITVNIQTSENANIDDAHSSSEIVTTSKSRLASSHPSILGEIFSLIKSQLFKQDKMLMRNLSLLIQQLLKQFDIAREELELSNQQISQETISSIADVLSLDNLDQNLMEDLGDFFFQLSKRKRENFLLISDYCNTKSSSLILKLNHKLNEFSQVFDDIKQKLPSIGILGKIDSRQLSQHSANEEEKQSDVMMIDTTLAPTQSKGPQYKLQPEDEKKLKQILRMYEDSEVLLRIFKLFNLFYEKFSSIKESKEPAEDQVVDTSTKEQANDALKFVSDSYQTNAMTQFVDNVSDVLRIVYKTNLDSSETVSNLIFCVFSSFYPELFQSIQKEEQQSLEEQKNPKDPQTKYKIKMMPISEQNLKASKEKFTLFRNAFYMTNRIEELSIFCLNNKRIINKMIKSKPSLFVNELEGLIKYMPNLLDFDNKRTYFKKELAKLKKNQYHDQIQLFIRREDIFRDSYAQIKDRAPEEMKGRLHIQFTGERGQDAGGLTRDFFIELSREMFNPGYSLFILSSSGSTYYPNPKSQVEPDHLKYFKFIGRMIGKALFDECLLECYFVKSLYKIMTGEPLNFTDVEDFDNEFFNNLKWCLENDVSCLMTTMVVEQDFFGKAQDIELVEGGKKIPVTNDNKQEYVEKLSYYKLYRSIQKQIDAFLEGFYELIPLDLVSIFNFKELELLISGLPNFDLEDLKANTEYSGYQPNSPQVQWLWEVLEQLENSERAEFLQFVTGSSKVPLDGFKGLIGMRGPQKFTIAKIKTDDIMRLPSGHTCFNQLDLPEYPSKEILHERLLIAIKETKGFGFA